MEVFTKQQTKTILKELFGTLAEELHSDALDETQDSTAATMNKIADRFESFDFEWLFNPLNNP